MDEKKMLEKIRQSGEEITPPKALHPQEIQKKIKDRPQRRHRIPVYRLGMAAAAVVLVCTLLWQQNQNMRIENQKFAAETAESASDRTDGEESAEERTIETETEAVERADSEETLYAALSRVSSRQSRVMKEELAMDATGSDSMSGLDSTIEMAYAETNLQEVGVDEGDIVKTDGNYLYTLQNNQIQIVRAEGSDLSAEGVIALENTEETIEEFYLDADTLLIIATTMDSQLMEDSEDVYYIEQRNNTTVYAYDISDRTTPTLAGEMMQEGYYKTSRKNGTMLYLFTEYAPEIAARQEDSHYLPEVAGEKMGVDEIYLPDNIQSTNYLVISSMDVRQPRQVVDRKAIITTGVLFYVSTEHIYLCETSYENGMDRTSILKFSYQEGNIYAEAVGEVKGYLNDSFSLNESEGYLRLVTTEWSGEDGTSLNHLYVLDEELTVCGSIKDLAPGEDIRSARFFGDVGYFVTFRDMDPLFSVDLSDPTDPKILGELKITGFSSYLHFYGEGKLVGIGNEIDPESGEYKGIKLSIFDISDPSAVTEVDKYVLKETYDCPGLYNYKAILADPEKNLIGFECDGKYMVFSYEEEGVVQKFFYDTGEEYGEDYGRLRGLYIGTVFYLSKASGIEAFDMENDFVQSGAYQYEE